MRLLIPVRQVFSKGEKRLKNDFHLIGVSGKIVWESAHAEMTAFGEPAHPESGLWLDAKPDATNRLTR